MEAGLLFAFSAAFVSGFSIFANKLGVSGVNPFMFTLLKNAFVSCLLLSGIILARDFRSLRKLTRPEWKRLALIGLVGGSIPFLMFFWGLSITAAAKAAALQKSMFIPASILAYVFLKESLSKKAMAASSVVLAGILIASFSYFGEFNAGDGLVLGASLLWAAEAVLSRRALRSMKASTVAFGRMFFGAAFMVPILLMSGNMAVPASADNYAWIAITSALLLAYVALWYGALKRTTVSAATTALVASVPVTAALSVASGTPVPAPELFGAALITLGLLMLASSAFSLRKIVAKAKAVANERNAIGAYLRAERQ